LRPERILVTGATGHLGGEIMAQAREAGIAALGLGRDPARIERMQRRGFAVLAHDLAETLPAAARDVDAVIHCAALSAPFGPTRAFVQANVGATQTLLDAFQRLHRFVLVSSPSVYFAFADDLMRAEDGPLPPPVNAYAATKRQAEVLALSHPALNPVILRPRGIYGAGDSALLPRLLRAARRGPLPLLRGGVAEIDLTHVADAARACLAALAAPHGAVGGIYNISGGEVLPVTEIAGQTCARAGVALAWRPVPLRPALALAGAAELWARLVSGREPAITRYGLGLFAYRQSLDLSAAAVQLGWRPEIPFARGLLTALPAP
jgi:nucleoside-diphosphate-sugar epimerase